MIKFYMLTFRIPCIYLNLLFVNTIIDSNRYNRYLFLSIVVYFSSQLNQRRLLSQEKVKIVSGTVTCLIRFTPPSYHLSERRVGTDKTRSPSFHGALATRCINQSVRPRRGSAGPGPTAADTARTGNDNYSFGERVTVKGVNAEELNF